MANGWRYIAQRVTGSGTWGNFLDFNLPLQGVELEEVLSGHNALTATISPEIARLKAPDGRPLLEEWGTAIWAEDPDGEIRGGGILTHSDFNGPVWGLECTDLSGALVDLPYTEANYYINVDPLDILREIWRYAQAQAGGNLSVEIDPLKSPVLLGGELIQQVDFDTEPDPSTVPVVAQDPLELPQPLPVAPNRFATNGNWRDAAVKHMGANGWNKAKVDDALRKWLNKDDLVATNKWTALTEEERKIRDRAVEKMGPPPVPPSGWNPPRVGFVDQNPVTNTVPADGTTDAPPNDTTTPEQTISWVYDAYKLNWYTNHNLDGTIEELSAATPFDWLMTHRWNDDEIVHRIKLGYPRIGRRREELRFVIGENIKVIPSVTHDGGEYANEVLVLGAGEGSAQLMARAYRRDDNRVRRVAVISAPECQTSEAAQSRANAEIAARYLTDDVTEITLSDHSHAPMGSVDLGDEILIEGETGWIDLEVWCRVVTRTLSPDAGDSMRLTVIRSDRLV